MSDDQTSIATPYTGQDIVLTSKHEKVRAIGPVFKNVLGACVVPCELDTDQLGTFSGEVDRPANADSVVRTKCEWGMRETGLRLGLASEGSFGPHPLVPFLAVGCEWLCFIDQDRGLELQLTRTTEKTNYRTATVSQWSELEQFAVKAGFPEHALILRPADEPAGSALYKGINKTERLREVFEVCKNQGSDTVWVETDMRAHFNPTRMSEIAQLAAELAERLCCQCPACASPGWGPVDVERGLPCSWCGTPTRLVKAMIHGCAGCEHQQLMPRQDGLSQAEPGECARCNP